MLLQHAWQLFASRPDPEGGVDKVNLVLERPLLNAAGTLGFAPDRASPVQLSHLGAFVTNPVSLEPRTAAHGPRVVVYPGGFLLHTGYPNPGLRAVLRRYASRWGQLPIPLLVHILARTPDDVYRVVLELEKVDGVTGVEIGLPPGITPDQAVAMYKAARGERAVILRLPFENALEVGEALMPAGAPTVSLGPPRGLLPGPTGRLVSGRLYGPAVFPLVLPVVRSLAELGLEVIGGGGIYTAQQVAVMLSAGAAAVQLDAVLWRGDIPAIH
jgi:dihydroorotate dehydrogenase (NAD+) catalytic subunit